MINIKKIADKNTLLVMLLYLIFSFYISLQCINRYPGHVSRCEELQELEQARNKKAIDAIRSGLIGSRNFNSMAMLTPVGLLFHDALLSENLHSTIDNSGVVLNNYEKSDKNLPRKRSGIFYDHSRYSLWVLSLLSSLLGFMAFLDRQYIYYLLNSGKKLCAFFNLFLTRWFYIAVTVLLSTAFVFLLFAAKGTALAGAQTAHLPAYAGTTIIAMAFFLLLGLLLGLARNIYKGGLLLILLWGIFIYILPGLMDDLFIKPLTSRMTSVYQHESKKSKLYNDSENLVKEKIKNTEIAERKLLINDLHKRYLEKEYEEIKALEAGIIKESEETAGKIFLISIFLPSTFYDSVAGEMTIGYKAQIDFHKFNFARQQKIVEFYNKSFYEKDCKIDEIPVIYRLKSYLPDYFGIGLLVNGLIVFLFFWLVYFCFLKAFFPCRRADDFKGLEIHSKKGDYLLFDWKDAGKYFRDNLINIFFNKKARLAGKITVDDRSYPGLKAFYLPDLRCEKIKDCAQLFNGEWRGLESKSFAELTFAELVRVFPQIKQCDILILDNLDYAHRIEADKSIVIIELHKRYISRRYSHLYSIFKGKTEYSADIWVDKK